MNTIQSIIQAFFAKVLGEDAPTKIARKQAEINSVVDRNTASINTTIDTEIDNIASAARIGFGRIDQLLGTGALGTSKAKAVDAARVQLSKALEQLDAALA